MGEARSNPAAGRLLVATPTLTEAAFTRTVVYLLEHDGAGTVGVILNRPSHTPVGQVLPDWHDLVSDPALVFGGGPVQPDGALCVGESRGPDSPLLRRLSAGLCTVDLDAEPAQVQAVAGRLRVFAGHSGWAGGQLEGELEAGAWFVVEGSAEDVFCPEPEQLWRRVLLRQPPPLRFVSTFPKDPALN